MDDLVDCPSRIARLGCGLCDDEDGSMKAFGGAVSVLASIIRGDTEF